jgi:hypothetical protein
MTDETTRKFQGGSLDERPEAVALLKNIRTQLPVLEKELEEVSSHWGYEDMIYRFYHQSFKVYHLQMTTQAIVEKLKALMPGREMNAWFRQIVHEGTGKAFKKEDNQRWLEATRPILEAFFHARYFLDMAVRYGRQFEGHAPPNTLPSGWASMLYLFDLR